MHKDVEIKQHATEQPKSQRGNKKKYLKTYENGNIGFQNLCMYAKLLQSYPTFCDPMDCNLLGSSVHGILQARILKWIDIPFSSVTLLFD